MKEQTTIYGSILCIAAIYNYISYLWNYICIDVLNYNFTMINLFLGISCFIASVCTAYIIQNRLTKGYLIECCEIFLSFGFCSILYHINQIIINILHRHFGRMNWYCTHTQTKLKS